MQPHSLAVYRRIQSHINRRVNRGNNLREWFHRTIVVIFYRLELDPRMEYEAYAMKLNALSIVDGRFAEPAVFNSAMEVMICCEMSIVLCSSSSGNRLSQAKIDFVR